MFFLLFSVAEAAPAPAFPDRASVVGELVAADPDAHLAALDARAARAAVPAARALAPLELSAGVAPLMHHELGVEGSVGWMLPAPAMLSARARSAEAAVSAAEADVRMRELDAAARASQLYDRAWALLSGVAVHDHHAAVLREMSAAASRRVAAGLAPAEAVVMAEMARAEGDEARLAWAGQLRRVAAELRRSASGPAAQDLAERCSAAAAHLEGADSPAPDVPPDPGTVLPVGRAAPPAADMARADQIMAQEMDRMARAEGRPMTELMVEYSTMWGDPTMGLMVGVGVEVPLDARPTRARREAAAVEAARAERQAARAEADAAADEAAALAMVHEAEAMERLMTESMLPLAEQRVRLARVAFEAGRGSLEAWLEAERDAAQAALRRTAVRAELRSAEAMVAMARGLRAGMEVR